MPLTPVNVLDVCPCTYQSPPGRRDKFQRRRDMRRGKEEEERLREKEGKREGGCQQRKSTADSYNPRSLSQLGTIVIESPRQNLKRKPLQRQALLLCQPLKRLVYTIHQPLCVRGVDNREIWPRYVSVLSMMQLTEGQRDGETWALFKTAPTHRRA